MLRLSWAVTKNNRKNIQNDGNLYTKNNATRKSNGKDNSQNK
jgi:hypothetical protein